MKKEESLATWARDKFAEELRKSSLYSYVSKKSYPYADIVATSNDGTRKFFEIKASSISKEDLIKSINQRKKFFDATTLTEWNVAIQYPDNYVFVMLYIEEINGKRIIVGREEYSPEELLKFSTVPPFKINFNIPYRKEENTACVKHRSGTVSAFNREDKFSVVTQLISYYDEIGGDLVEPNNKET